MIKCLFIGMFSVSFILLSGCTNSDNGKNITAENSDKTDSTKNEYSEYLTELELRKIPSELIPVGYSIFEKIEGDLNKDGLMDSIIIIKRINEENIINDEYRGELDRNRRGILVFLDKEDNWELASQNLSCFSSENEDGGIYYPPELSVNVQKGNLYIHYAHGRYGQWKYTFRFQHGYFELIGYDSSVNYGPIVNSETSINFLSKKKLLRENVNENAEGNGDEIFEDTWENIEVKQLIKLSEIENFDELDLL